MAWVSGCNSAHKTSSRAAPACGKMAMVEGPRVQAHRVLSHRMLGFAVRHPIQRQLHDVVGALAIGSLGMRTCGFAPDPPGLLDSLVQPLRQHGVVPSDAD